LAGTTPVDFSDCNVRIAIANASSSNSDASRNGAPVEADHIVGDMIARGDAAKVPVPRLRTAYTHLKAYEKQRG